MQPPWVVGSPPVLTGILPAPQGSSSLCRILCWKNLAVSWQSCRLCLSAGQSSSPWPPSLKPVLQNYVPHGWLDPRGISPQIQALACLCRSEEFNNVNCEVILLSYATHCTRSSSAECAADILPSDTRVVRCTRWLLFVIRISCVPASRASAIMV